MHLMKKWEKQHKQMKHMRWWILEENVVKAHIDRKFPVHYLAVEAELKFSTMGLGLVTLTDMKSRQEVLVKEWEKQLAKKERSKELQLKLEKFQPSSLSFMLGEEEEEGALHEEELERESVTRKIRKLGKSPDVEMSFLPDPDGEEEENQLRQEWEAKQEQ